MPQPNTAPAPLKLTLYRKPGAKLLAFPPIQPPTQVDAGGAVITAKLQAVRTSNTW